jgi:hypothetical protein
MALDTSLLYGLTAASAVAHAALAFTIYVVMKMIGSTSSGTLQIILCLISVIIQFGLLTALQANTCGGVKDYGIVLVGTAISTIIVTGFTLLPVYVPYMREIVSWLAPRASPADAEIAKTLEVAAMKVQELSGEASGADKMAPPDVTSTSLLEYEQATFLATTKAVAFWAAFAGAYGIAAGSLKAAACPANK